ncbi:hypothetical protein JOD45_002113 [Scopulibacillus daqui]|uniref:Uncharacterized protein n=1 Tax=Scopulibacillus daqui TaxID=1469162 RepID=A0ABS2Q0R8_9BACL|nr:DUF6270 domain-containing protein [Scopulibacillus daqui]MBM7645888.1 hypothetical protein [Scopulibacillus daqui]
MKKIKLAIIGTAATRGCFELADRNKLEKIINWELLQYQSSAISYASDKPFDIDFNKLKDVSAFSAKNIKQDIDKDLFKRLLEFNPEYIIFDFLAEVNYGVCLIKDSFITNNSRLKLFVEEQDHIEKYSFNHNREAFEGLLKDRFEAICRFLSDHLPNTKIIIHIPQFAGAYYDDHYILRSLNRTDILKRSERINRVSNQFEEISLSHGLPVHVISMQDKKYFSNSKHKWGIGFNHYESSYYIDFQQKLLTYIIGDLLGH